MFEHKTGAKLTISGLQVHNERRQNRFQSSNLFIHKLFLYINIDLETLRILDLQRQHSKFNFPMCDMVKRN